MIEERYVCNDPYLAAFLIERGHDLVGTENANTRVKFFFEWSAAGTAKEFINENPTVNIHNYLSGYRRVRTIIFNEKTRVR